MSIFKKKDLLILLLGGVLSTLSCIFFSNSGATGGGSTAASMAISAVYVVISFFLPLDQQLMLVALGLPNTKALGFGGISCSIIVCAVAVVKNFYKTKNTSSIVLVVVLYVLYSLQYLFRFDNYMIGLIMPIKTGINLLFFYIVATNTRIASNSFKVGFKTSVALFVGIVSAFWISFNQADADTSRVAIEGNDPNILAVEAAFTAAYLSVYYYSKESFSKWFFLIAVSILSAISLLCGSRMGLILMSFTIVLAVLLNVRQFNRSSLLVLVFGTALVAFLLSPTGQAVVEALIMRNENLERSGNISNDRFELWSMYASVFNSDPILWFSGLGDYKEYGLPKQAHNFLIEDIAAYGILGVAILYFTYWRIYLGQYKLSKKYNNITSRLFSKLPVLIPLIGGMTLHGLTSIMNTTMLYLGVLCMTMPKNYNSR